MSLVGTLGVPLSRVRKLTITATAGNVVVHLSPGAGFRWLVQYGAIELVTDANVFNRALKVRVTDAGGNQISPHFVCTTAIPASTTGIFSIFNMDVGNMKVAEGYENIDYGYLIAPYIVNETDRLTLEIGAGQAGDSWAGTVVVLEVPVS